MEVLKGAGTALYGSDAVAATIDIKSLKSYKEKESNNSIKLREGSIYDYKASIEYENNIKYLVGCGNCQTKFLLPVFDNATLYEVLLSMHDGSFFAS